VNVLTLTLGTIIVSLGTLYAFYTMRLVENGKIPAGFFFQYISSKKDAMNFWFLALINGFIALTVLIFGICLSMLSLSF